VRWSLAPRYRPGNSSFNQAVEETDAVVSTSRCTVSQFRDEYNYDGPVHIVRSHNLQFFDDVVPMPEGPPWKIGFMGRLDIAHKNLDTVLDAVRGVMGQETDVQFHLYGDGEVSRLKTMAEEKGISDRVYFHGRYDHKRDLPDIVSNCHFFVYTSRREGGPCFSLLELLQAGRYVVASPVGGIPDLYAGRPEIGSLVTSDRPAQIQDALLNALDRVRNGDIEPKRIRDRYFEEFDMTSAHDAWRRVVLNTSPPETYVNAQGHEHEADHVRPDAYLKAKRA
jgi:glycosyltransferase involved in cell wall biosynthesis